MGKLRPSILTGMFSHLSMNKKKKTEYEDLKQISPKSKVKQKSKGKKMLSDFSTKIFSIKGSSQKNILLSPSEPSTPVILKKTKKKSFKLPMAQILENTRNALTSKNKYKGIEESPVQSSALEKREKFKNSKACSLREQMLNKLKAARFRYMNEQMYTSEGKDAGEMFAEDPTAYKAYHEGYRQQVNQWPVNPLDIIIKSLKKRAKKGKLVVADFGCGEARLAQTLPCTVHSLDLVAVNDHVIQCDMARTPLADGSVDVVVFCLSLMGTNVVDYIREANRVLKEGGIMKIAEIGSRFEELNNFINGVERMGFESESRNVSHNFFYFLDFKKKSNVSKKKKKKFIDLSLKPCFYKKR